MKVAHLIPWMDGYGTEQVLLNLCKYGNKSETEQFVVALREGPFASEIETTGASVFIATKFKEIIPRLKKADIVNLHWLGYNRSLYIPVLMSLKPHVTTLHWASPLPDLPALTICTSHYAQKIQKNPKRFVVIPNGIDLTRFYPRPKSPRRKIILIRVCRPEKCADYFWEAMDGVLEECKEAELWIVGEEGKSKSTERIRFLGVRRDIPEILAQADIFVYTPLPKAGTKDLVIMEAMAMGLPCVVSDVEAAKESITHLHNGILVPFGDSKAFVETTLALIENPELREKLGKNAANTARRKFDVRKKVIQYEKIYRFVITNGIGVVTGPTDNQTPLVQQEA